VLNDIRMVLADSGDDPADSFSDFSILVTKHVDQVLETWNNNVHKGHLVRTFCD
jgi:hypothetical protein